MSTSDEFREMEKRPSERLAKYFEGLADGALWGGVFGCVIGVSIVVPGCHLYGVGEEPNEKISQEVPVKLAHRSECNLPKNTP